MTDIVHIDPEDIDYDLIQQVAGVVRAGGVLIFPTDTVYGIGCNVYDEDAVERVFEIKGRDADKAMPVLVGDTEQAEALAADMPEAAITLMEKFWPGPLTIVVKKAEDVPEIVTGGAPTVGIRVPDSEICRVLIQQSMPIVAPSANRQGVKPPAELAEVDAAILDAVDLGIASGRAVGVPSTVVEVNSRGLKLIREGSITLKELEQAIGL